MDTSSFVAVVRSRWHLEVMALQMAGVDGRRVGPRERFVYRPLGPDLALILASDRGDRLEYVDVGELKQSGIDHDAALDMGWSNSMREIAQNGEVRFEAMPEFGWMPATAGSDECVILLAQPENIRSLPVVGRHVVFAPTTRGFWVADSENLSGIELLCELARNEYENPEGKPLSAVPYLLDDDGNWLAWQPPPDDPSFWPVRTLQVRQADELYAAQREMLRRQSEDDPDAPHIAKFFTDSFLASGAERIYSYSVWGDCTTLLPKTDMVVLKPLINRAELKRNENAEPQFGEAIRVAWDELAADLKPQGMYPERYLAADFPSPKMFSRLAERHVEDARDLFQDGKRAADLAASAESAPVTVAAWQPPGNGRVAVILGVIAAAVFLCFGCGIASFVMLFRSLPAVASTPAQPHIPPAANANGAGQQTFDSALEAVQRALHAQAKAVELRMDIKPLREFPELPMPEKALPVLEVKRRGSISVAHPRAPQTFRDQPEDAAWLVGFRVVTGRDWGGVVRGLQPIYQQEDRYKLGAYIGDPGGVSQTQLLARPGYAVSAIAIQRGLVFNALRVTFSRVGESDLDLADSYQSDWVGVNDGRETEAISGAGFPIVGITGMYENGCFGDISLMRGSSQGDVAGPDLIEWSPLGKFADLPEAQEPLPSFEAALRETVSGRSGPIDERDRADDEAPDGSWLVGFRVVTGSHFGGVLQSVQPIYQTDSQYTLGKTLGASGGVQQTQVLARPGYAVAHVELQRGAVVNCIRVTFAHVVDQHFDSADSYTTPWLGYSDTRAIESLSSDDEPLVGIVVSQSHDCLGDLRVIRAVVPRSEIQ